MYPQSEQLELIADEPTDEGIYREAMTEWVETLAQLWDAVGKPVDPRRLDVYGKQLRNVPLGLLEIGVNYAISNNTYSTVPPVGKVFEGIRKEMARLNLVRGEGDMDEMIERWLDHKASGIFYRFA